MEFEIETLIWDEENQAHIWDRHGLSPQEVEQAVRDHENPSRSHSGRLVLRGRTLAGKKLIVILAPGFNETSWYVVTARPASKQERKRFGEGEKK